MTEITEQLKKKIVEKLQTNPITSRACKELGIARSTFYRWKEEDKEFKITVEKSQMMGRAIICDVIESKLLNLLNSNNDETVFKTAKFLLLHLHPIYKNSNESMQYQKAKLKDEISREKEKFTEITEVATGMIRLLIENGQKEASGSQVDINLEEIKNKLLSTAENNNKNDNISDRIKELI